MFESTVEQSTNWAQDQRHVAQLGCPRRQRRLFLSLIFGTIVALPIASADARKTRARPDLAEVVQGSYYGDVISDSTGSSRSDVTITVKKIGLNTVQVSSDYKRLPAIVVRLTRAMHTIQQASGDNVFLVDQSKTPWGLDVTVDGASWSGTKQ
ncbi:MAG: hypothetical protein ACRCY3_13785 [Sphingorhabdus sp.]